MKQFTNKYDSDVMQCNQQDTECVEYQHDNTRLFCSRIRGRVGFTLVETLLALMILVILTGIVAMGIPVAFRTYTDAVNCSNAKVLLSTTSTILRDELSMAQKQVTIGDNLYYMDGEGYWSRLDAIGSSGNNPPTIKKHIYILTENVTSPSRDEDFIEVSDSPYEIISERALAENLGIRFDSIVYSNRVFTINNLEAINKDDEHAYAATGSENENEYKIRAVMLREE